MDPACPEGNRIAPQTITKILHSVSKTKAFGLYRNSMAIGGVDGTLKKRFRNSPAKGHVFAKTGYINSVSALSGYVSSSSDSSPKGVKHWTFAILVNKFPKKGGLWAARELQESLVEAIYSEIARPNS